MTSTTLLIRGSPLAANQPAKQASPNRGIARGLSPSALYRSVLTQPRTFQHRARSGSLPMRSSHARSSSSNAAALHPSSLPLPRNESCFRHFAFNIRRRFFISFIVPPLNRTIQDCRHCQLLQAPDVRHEPLNFLGFRLFHKPAFVFPFRSPPQVSRRTCATASSLKLTTPMLFPRASLPCRSRHGKRALRFKGAGALFILHRLRTSSRALEQSREQDNSPFVMKS